MPSSRLALLLCMTVFLAVWQTGRSAADDGSRATVQSIEVTAEQVTVHLSAASVYTQAALPKDPLHGRADRCYVDVAGVLGQQVERWYVGMRNGSNRSGWPSFSPRRCASFLISSPLSPARSSKR